MKYKPHYGWESIEGRLESYKQGIGGLIQEWNLCVKDWGMNLQNIKHPVTLLNGPEDEMEPVSRGQYYSELLPNSNLKIMNNEARFSLIRSELLGIRP